MWVSVFFCKHFMSSSGLKKEVKDEIVIKVGVHDSLTSIKRNNNIIIKVHSNLDYPDSSGPQ